MDHTLENLKVKPYGRPLAEILFELEKPLSEQFLRNQKPGLWSNPCLNRHRKCTLRFYSLFSLEISASLFTFFWNDVYY